jgi:hypothetical protein
VFSGRWRCHSCTHLFALSRAGRARFARLRVLRSPRSGCASLTLAPIARVQFAACWPLTEWFRARLAPKTGRKRALTAVSGLNPINLRQREQPDFHRGQLLFSHFCFDRLRTFSKMVLDAVACVSGQQAHSAPAAKAVCHAMRVQSRAKIS